MALIFLPCSFPSWAFCLEPQCLWRWPGSRSRGVCQPGSLAWYGDTSRCRLLYHCKECCRRNSNRYEQRVDLLEICRSPFQWMIFMLLLLAFSWPWLWSRGRGSVISKWRDSAVFHIWTQWWYYRWASGEPHAPGRLFQQRYPFWPRNGYGFDHHPGWWYVHGECVVSTELILS